MVRSGPGMGALIPQSIVGRELADIKVSKEPFFWRVCASSDPSLMATKVCITFGIVGNR